MRYSKQQFKAAIKEKQQKQIARLKKKFELEKEILFPLFDDGLDVQGLVTLPLRNEYIDMTCLVVTKSYIDPLSTLRTLSNITIKRPTFFKESCDVFIIDDAISKELYLGAQMKNKDCVVAVDLHLNFKYERIVKMLSARDLGFQYKQADK